MLLTELLLKPKKPKKSKKKVLNEILDKPSKHIKQSNKPVYDILSHKKHEVIGVGGQAIAYLHKQYPGKVIKTVQVYGTNDPVYQFLRMVLKHQHNPFFPRIQAVKMYPTKEVHYTQREQDFEHGNVDKTYALGDDAPSQLDFTIYVVMEQLKSINDISPKLMQQLGIIVPELQPTEREFFNRIRTRTSVSELSYAFRMAFESHLTRKEMYNTTNNPAFKQALKLLEPLFKHFEPDIHLGNVMLRGKNQLVFVDPIAHSSYD